MNTTITLIVSLAAALSGNIAKKYYTDKTEGLAGGFVFNAVGCLTAALILLLWGGFGTPSVFTIALGVVFGAVTALQGITNIAALQFSKWYVSGELVDLKINLSLLPPEALPSAAWLPEPPV